MSDDAGALHAARIAELVASLRELVRLQEESEQLAAEARARVRRVTEELRLLTGTGTRKGDPQLEET